MSDATGAFEVRVESHEVAGDEGPLVAVEVDHPGFALWQGGFHPSLKPLEITLVPGRAIRFQLIDADYGPAQFARVANKAHSWSHHISSVDADGSFRVSIPLAETAIEIDVPGVLYPIIERDVVLPAGGDLDFGRMVVKEVPSRTLTR